MEITITGNVYKFELPGTVGILWAAEKLLPLGEDGKKQEISLENPRHHLYIYYAVLKACNKNMNDIESFEDFELRLTAHNIKLMRDHIFTKWREYEPEVEKIVTEEEEEKKQ